MSPKRFANLYLEFSHISSCLCIVGDTEYRELRNGVRLQFQHKDSTILANFPSSNDWHDYSQLRHQFPPKVLACAPLGSFPQIPRTRGMITVGGNGNGTPNRIMRRPSRRFLVEQVKNLLGREGAMPMWKIRNALRDKNILVSKNDCAGAVRCLEGRRVFGAYPHTANGNGGRVLYYYLLDTGART